MIVTYELPSDPVRRVGILCKNVVIVIVTYELPSDPVRRVGIFCKMLLS